MPQGGLSLLLSQEIVERIYECLDLAFPFDEHKGPFGHLPDMEARNKGGDESEPLEQEANKEQGPRLPSKGISDDRLVRVLVDPDRRHKDKQVDEVPDCNDGVGSLDPHLRENISPVARNRDHHQESAKVYSDLVGMGIHRKEEVDSSPDDPE